MQTPSPTIHLIYSSDQIAKHIRNLIPAQSAVIDRPLAQLAQSSCSAPADLFLLCQNGTGRISPATITYLRTANPETPILFVADGPPADDHTTRWILKHTSDYVILPVSPREFIRRLHRLVRGSRSWLHWWKRLKDRLFGQPITATERQDVTPQLNTGNRLSLRLLGTFEIRKPGTEIEELSSQQNKRLLAYFAYHHPRKLRRDKVIADFWPHAGQEAARNSFNVALCHLRQYFRTISGREDQIILHQNGSYLLNPDWPVQVDVHTFMHHYQIGTQMEAADRPQEAYEAFRRAEQLYRGDFLEEFPFDEWTFGIRDHLRERYFYVLDRLGRSYLQDGKYKHALQVYQKMIDSDPCLESGHRFVMWCFAYLGQRDRAIRQYLRCRQVLSEELQVPPSQKTEQLYQLILKGEKPKLAAFLN